MKAYSEDMQRLAEEAVIMAKQMNVDLDYTSSSVEKLDNVLEGFHQQIPEANPSEDQVAGMALGFGAYLGECIRRNLGGEWEFFQDADAIKLGQEYIFVAAKAYRRLKNGSEDSVVALYESVRRDYPAGRPQ